jgi:hypothetical protein
LIAWASRAQAFWGIFGILLIIVALCCLLQYAILSAIAIVAIVVFIFGRPAPGIADRDIVDDIGAAFFAFIVVIGGIFIVIDTLRNLFPFR